jgi:hypothetical protein
VGVLNSKADLGEPIEYLVFREILSAALSILDFRLSLYFSLEIAIITVVHHNAKFAFLCFVNFSKAGDVRMV